MKKSNDDLLDDLLKEVENCDIIIVGVPHKAYGNLVIPQEKEVIDLWNIL